MASSHISHRLRLRREMGSLRFPFDLGCESWYQNTAEFIRVVGSFLLAQRGCWGVTLTLKGDSETSLTWGRQEKFKGGLGKCASILFILLGVRFDFWVAEVEFMINCHGVKRHRIWGYRTVCGLDLMRDGPLMRIVELCDLHRNINDFERLSVFWKDIDRTIQGMSVCLGV